VIRAFRRGIQAGTYDQAIVAGATDDELYAAQDAGLDLHGYVDARIWGATHDDAMRAWGEGVNLSAYAAGREGGNSHADGVAFARQYGHQWARLGRR
jgi:hypothetical protein